MKTSIISLLFAITTIGCVSHMEEDLELVDDQYKSLNTGDPCDPDEETLRPAVDLELEFELESDKPLLCDIDLCCAFDPETPEDGESGDEDDGNEDGEEFDEEACETDSTLPHCPHTQN